MSANLVAKNLDDIALKRAASLKLRFSVPVMADSVEVAYLACE